MSFFGSVAGLPENCFECLPVCFCRGLEGIDERLDLRLLIRRELEAVRQSIREADLIQVGLIPTDNGESGAERARIDTQIGDSRCSCIG